MKKVKIKESELRSLIRGILKETIDKNTLLESGHYSSNHTKGFSMKDKIRLGPDALADGKNTKMHNYPIIRNGKTHWVSPSMTVSYYVFCKDASGQWCSLVEKRGDVKLWSNVKGYVDYGDGGLANTCKRECREETGVDVGNTNVIACGINDAHDDVSHHYYSILDGITDDYPIDISGCEPNEILDAMWLPIESIPKIKGWWGKQGQYMYEFATRLFGRQEKITNNNDYNSVISGLQGLLTQDIISQNEYDRILAILNTGN